MSLSTVILFYILGAIIILLFISLMAVVVEYSEKVKSQKEEDYKLKKELSIYKHKYAEALYAMRRGEDPTVSKIAVDGRNIKKLSATIEQLPFDSNLINNPFLEKERVRDELLQSLSYTLAPYVTFNSYYDNKLVKYINQAVIEVVE